MGNLQNKELKGTDEQFKHDVHTQLIQKGYDEVLSYKAYNKFPNNLNKALHWIETQTKPQKSNKISINDKYNKNEYTEKIRGKTLINDNDIDELSSIQTSSRFNASKSNQLNVRKGRFISRVGSKLKKPTTIKCDSISSCEAVESILSALYFYHQHKLKSKADAVNRPSRSFSPDATRSNSPQIGDEIEINSDPENIDDLETHKHQGKVCGFKKQKSQIDIKHNKDGEIHAYFLDEIQYKILQNDSNQADNSGRLSRMCRKQKSSGLVQYLHAFDSWINHYEHILYHHMNSDKQIQFIHHEFIQKYNIQCDLKKCSFYDRFKHKKYANSEDENEIYEQLFDAIHCHLLHSVQLDRDNVKKDKLNKFKDLFWKKYEQLNVMNLVQSEQKSDENLVLTEYSLGHRFYYWEYYRDSEWYVKRKYSSLKSEILNNTGWILTASKWLDTVEKAKKLWTAYKHTIKSADTNYWLHYLIDEDSEIDLEHVIVILLYTNFDKLSYQFSSTFRKISGNETNFQLKQRNAEFWNFSKLLRETVECWGTSVQQTEFRKFYHGLNVPMVVNSYTAGIRGPTSTTLKVHVAMLFGDGKGIVYQLEKYKHYNLRFFNCMFFSDFSNEAEMLFFGGQYPLQISGIIHVQNGENYQEFALNANIFENFITGKYDSAMSADIVLLKELMTSQLSFTSNTRRQRKNYLDNCFYQYCEKRKDIKINIYHLKNYYTDFQDLFLNNKCNNLLSIDFIGKLFQNCETIASYKTGIISSEYLSLLNSMLKKRPSKLQKIEIYCKRLIGLTEFQQYQILFNTIGWKLQKSSELPLILTVQRR